MAKVASQWVKGAAADGQSFSEKVDVLVTGEGEFSIKIPEALLVNCYRMLERLINASGSSRETWESRVSIKLWRDIPRVYCARMQDGIDFLCACAADMMSGVETIERIIVYNARLDASAYLEAGNVYPNGCGHPGGRWWEPAFKRPVLMCGERLPVFAIGVGATVYDRITTTRSSGSATVRYVAVTNPDNNHGIETDPLYVLNAFRHVKVEPTGAGVAWMPYTPEAALFFRDAMLAICRMAVSLDAFLGESTKLQAAIAARASGGLLGFDGGATK